MKSEKIKLDLVMIIIVSFLGYCFEDFWMLIRYSNLDNRNMYLPFLLGYGVFIVLIYYIIGTPNKIFNKYEKKKPFNYLLYILVAFLLVSVSELTLGVSVERTLHFSYWDYSKIPLHFTKYVSIPTSIGFALVLTLFMSYLFEPLKNKISDFSKKIPKLLLILVISVMTLDLIVSFKVMNANDGRNIVWQIDFK